MLSSASVTELEMDAAFMREALRQAEKAARAEEVPIGAVVVQDGRIIARAWNQVELLKDATAHAEMLAITQAEAAVGDWRLNECDLYVTKEPCPMCAGALVHVRMRRVIFGCADERGGAAGGLLNLLQMPTLNHHCEITPRRPGGGVPVGCEAIFFRARRKAGCRGSCLLPEFLVSDTGSKQASLQPRRNIPGMESSAHDPSRKMKPMRQSTSATQVSKAEPAKLSTLNQRFSRAIRPV